MAEVPDKSPEKLKRNGREDDQQFEQEELLYRRFKEEHQEGAKIAFDALELPDMSVNRQKYCSDPAWTLIPIKRIEGRDESIKWGVFRFLVRDIPPELNHHTGDYTFEPRHRSEPKNFSHSEVWAFKEGSHIDLSNSELLLNPDAHQQWRQRLAWKCYVLIEPQFL